MRKISASCALTVYHDDQFWVGLAERMEGGELSVARIVFGAEPSTGEIQKLVMLGWGGLRFTAPVACERPKPAANPKRRQREAARDLRRRGPSTRAQAALSEQREAAARERKAEASRERERARQGRYEQRRARRKRKRRSR